MKLCYVGLYHGIMIVRLQISQKLTPKPAMNKQLQHTYSPEMKVRSILSVYVMQNIVSLNCWSKCGILVVVKWVKLLLGMRTSYNWKKSL